MDVPARHTASVSFLQLRGNRTIVRRWQFHMLSSGLLDSPDCPVRVAVKPATAGQDGIEKLDPTAAPVVADAAKLETWRKGVVRFRCIHWAVMHVVGGAPARHTESAGTNICASAARSHRSLFVGPQHRTPSRWVRARTAAREKNNMHELKNHVCARSG